MKFTINGKEYECDFHNEYHTIRINSNFTLEEIAYFIQWQTDFCADVYGSLKTITRDDCDGDIWELSGCHCIVEDSLGIIKIFFNDVKRI